MDATFDTTLAATLSNDYFPICLLRSVQPHGQHDDQTLMSSTLRVTSVLAPHQTHPTHLSARAPKMHHTRKLIQDWSSSKCNGAFSSPHGAPFNHSDNVWLSGRRNT